MNADILLKHFDRISDAPDAVIKFRQLVLELAVRGKLVVQDSNDEPVLQLLNCIQDEKNRRIKSGQIKRQDPLPQVNANEKWFIAPTNWQWVRLGTITQILMGQSPPGDTYNKSGEGVPLINGPVEFTEGPFGITTINQYTTAPTNMCEEGDLLLCVRGSTTGRTNIAGFNACIGRGVAAIRPFFADKYVRLFVWRLRASIIAMGRGIAFPSVSRQQIEELPIPLPPLAEQHRIVAKVDELMVLCDQLEAARNKREARRDRMVASSLNRISTTTADKSKDAARFHLNHLPRLTTRPEHIKQLRQTILNLAVRGRLVPQDPNDEPAAELLKRIQIQKNGLGNKASKTVQRCQSGLPNGWVAVELFDYVLDVCTGPFGSMLHKSDYITDGIPLVNPSHMINDRIVPDGRVSVSPEVAERLSSYRLKPGDIVMARRGEVGRAALVEQHQDGWLCGTGSFFLRFSPEINYQYFLLLLRSSQTRTYLTGKAVGTTMVNLNHGILNKAHLEIPPLAEQHRIVAKIDELMALCDQLEANLTATTADSRRLLEAVLRDALQPALETAV